MIFILFFYVLDVVYLGKNEDSLLYKNYKLYLSVSTVFAFRFNYNITCFWLKNQIIFLQSSLSFEQFLPKYNPF